MKTFRRHGFTLVELLVVIAIIAILAALSGAGIFVLVSGRQQSNTEANIRVINKLMQDRWGEVIKSAKNSNDPPSPAVLALANNDVERAKVIWIKVRLMEAFPQSYAEVNTPVVLANLIPANRFKPHFAKYQTALKLKAGGAGESSACLLLALKTLSPDGMLAIQDQLNNSIADTDGDGVMEFVDGWGNPLVFTRFNTGANVQAINPALGNPGNRAFKYSDPVDTNGTLLATSWYLPPPVPPASNPNRYYFETNIHMIARGVDANGSPLASFTIPVIQSAGKDGAFNTGDDIFSFNLKGD
jgi:prepilin-type N-terminal cleavage/methylation domain-containing protein